MMLKPRYKILKHQNIVTLQEMVEELLSLGWKLQGGVSPYKVEHETYPGYMQALTRYYNEAE